MIKAFGYYAVTKEFTLGANALLSSGRPRQCLSPYVDADNSAAIYGCLFHYCSVDGAAVNTPSPRGSTGRLPWTKTLDLDFSYKPSWESGLELKADIHNVFNSQTAARQRDSSSPASRYQMITNYTTPRYMRFSAVYGVKL